MLIVLLTTTPQIFKLFEPGLTKAPDNTICPEVKYPYYNSTVTHGVWYVV